MQYQAWMPENYVEALREGLKLVYTAFLKHNPKYLPELEILTKKLQKWAQGNIPSALAPPSLALSISQLSIAVQNKIREGLLFSDKAVAEVRELFEGTEELLGHFQDLLLTRNSVLRQYILGKASEFEEKMRHFATEHEERLIKGICLPRSSTVYLALLDAFKEVLWGLKEAASKMAP
ncbi:hypothetical protein SAMN00808754_3246 [Thermanaeromonas toyohensis ToBE]|uniref:Uncharacterized protein n=1 Tax=Thermanaeromonas toyohensis ToBE TaxID=698762 RepID=A0A1W1W360_9FIRM|nr:hypothetical protein [Thermanaeromonas toyohensis]SMC00057.1 hypothetical protein SAMN00808754_3246 [Thermanaeromonas toyohensis ToBE]